MRAESPTLVAQYLKAGDPARYYASLVLPEPARGPVQALCAFSADVASIRSRVSEPAPGEIRLQWWDDALTGQGHGDVTANPLADALLDTIARFSLPVVPLRRLIAARRFDLYDDPMPDMTSFEGYAGETVSVLYQFAAMILDNGKPVEPGDAAGHLGVAEALAGHIRAFGYYASQGRIVLPWAVLAAHGVTEAQVFSGTTSEGLEAALRHLRQIAGDHLAKAETAIAALPRHLRPAFAAIAPLKAELGRLEKSASSPFVSPVSLPDWRRIALLAFWAWRNR